MRAAGEWSPIADSLEAIFLADRGGADAGAPPSSLRGLSDAQRAALFAELDTLRQELRAGERDSTAALRGLVTVKRFDLTIPPVGSFSATLFRGRRAAPVRVDDGTDPDTRRSVCWLAFAAKDLATLFGGPGREALARALRARAERWDNFARKGYSMLPHELLINGRLPRATLEPPRVQLVVAHPSAGAQLVGEAFTSLSKLQRVDVLAVEPAGALFYGSQHRWYAGATWVVTFPSGGGGAGSGIMAHYSPVGRLGFVWRARDADGRRRSAVVLSLDLYRYLTGVAEQWKQLARQAIADCLKDAPACVATTP